MTAEIIYFNGYFKGVGTFNKKITAVAIKNKKFLKFGTDDEILKLKATNTKLIDLQSLVVKLFMLAMNFLTMIWNYLQ